jgi:hypothetical protein
MKLDSAVYSVTCWWDSVDLNILPAYHINLAMIFQVSIR